MKIIAVEVRTEFSLFSAQGAKVSNARYGIGNACGIRQEMAQNT
jgi:hypothetical protein